jgi:predicted SnoaL-like aldol condensation-catalyzing enzyme
MATTTISHRDAALAFLELGSSGKVREAYDNYIASNFRHHNPYFPGDAASLSAGMAENAKKFPNKKLHVERAIEEGDLVAVHSRVRLSPEMPEMALVHIFRFQGDRIVELWDVGQPAPDDSVNENGMF